MYLKSVEIQGFKSFANKIRFQFHNGITGIVGPNGSGKSNVADAVRWVLGEQKVRQLRSTNMQDIIFSGTETRKPLSYAYVAITLDNSDHQLATSFEEVTVARRIYRSGESEYLMNGTPCRLRDINELFYDTGVGKEGYSIIGQGQIDKILSGKPEDRRELFDEAAGIVKFKRRKAAAQQKLENEKLNLVRVKDILSELEKQIGPLEKQSEVAKEYLKKKDELKTLDVNVFLLENDRLKEQLVSVQEKYRIASEELNKTSEQYHGIKEEYHQLQEQMEALDTSIEEVRSSVTDSGLARGKLEGDINLLKEQINSAMERENHLNSRRNVIEEEIRVKEKDKEGNLANKEETDRQVQESIGFRDQAREHLDTVQSKIASLNQKIETGKNTIINELNQRATIKSTLGRFDTMMEQINIRKSELDSRLIRAKSDEEEREESIKKLEADFDRIGKELKVLTAKERQTESEIGAIRPQLAGMDGKLRETQAKFHQDKTRLEALANMAERYEGYGGSVKKVMEQKGNEKGIIGVVADIIKAEKKYETAIETALGSNIQNIVTRDEGTAKKMIRFLKEGRLGRATFLPLTSIANAQTLNHKAVLKEQGVIGMAHELVQVEEEYRNVAKSMLGRIVVVDHMDHAVDIARKFDYSIRMVTLEGELLVPGGAISGGAFKNGSNLLGRRREIEELKKQVRQQEQEISKINQDIVEIKESRNKLRLGLETLKGEIQQKSIEQNTTRLNLSQTRERMREEEESFLNLQQEGKEIELQTLEIHKGKEKTSRELQESEELEQKVQEEIGAYQKKLEEKRLVETDAAAQAAEWDLKVEKMLQTQEFQQTNVDRISGEIERLSEDLKEVTQTLIQIKEDAEQKKDEILKLEKTIADSQTLQTESEKKLKEQIAQKEKLSLKQKEFFNSREETAERMTGLDKEVYRLNAQKERLEESIESQINYMWDEYEITLSAAASIRNEEMTNLSEMKKGITLLREQIKKLGDVNVNAIEDYKNLMERYSFMKEQHDDLEEAEKTLEDIIQELDSAMRKQFQEKFGEISREFDKVFKELFGGGKGTLELMEDEDLLEAGIRIIAQPPGKKLQNMMQLSGGEKSLTAIALLFAIQNLKPSPFCLLDEIEAALDESNVGRFAKYLHKLTRKTQFIVITHRRGTMERVDRLYGITMQEKGVSTLVSVNLIDKDLED